jgi:SHS2 domain-containing protein
MKSFQIISHTADVRIKTQAGDIESLFEVALEGLVSILNPDHHSTNNEDLITIDISVSSVDKTSLLIDFLSEALTQMYIRHALIKKVKFHEFSDKFLSASFMAFTISNFTVDVKAVTYHEAEIKINNLDEYECTIVLDI